MFDFILRKIKAGSLSRGGPLAADSRGPRGCTSALVALLALSPCWAGDTFVDCQGKAHDWHITPGHTLIWDGSPYLPFGGMFVAASLYQPGDKNFERDRSILLQVKRHGIRDLYLNTLWQRSPEITQRLIDLFEELGFRYGLQFPVDALREAPGYSISADRYVQTVTNPGTVRFPTPGTRPGAAPCRGLYLVAGRDGQVLDSGVVTADAEEFRIQVARCPGGAATVKVVPRFTCRQWISEDAGRLLEWLKPLRLGPDFRFLIDPVANEYRPPRHFLLSSSAWQAMFAGWLRSRYGTARQLCRAWGISPSIGIDFPGAARLVPVLAGASDSGWQNRGYAMDPSSQKVVTVDMTVSHIWLDMCHAREDALRKALRKVCNALRQVCDVPIVAKRHHESTRLWISRDGERSIDGLGMESYGTGDRLARFNAAATYADVAQSHPPIWCVVTEFNSPGWHERHIGYPSRAQMYDDLNLLLGLGGRGVFMFGLSLRATPGDNMWTIFELCNDPRQLEWLATFAKAARSQPGWTEAVPQTGFWYPVENDEAAAFQRAGTPHYGLSGRWHGERAVAELGPGRWAAPVFDPTGLTQILYSRNLLELPFLHREAQRLRSVVPGVRAYPVELADPLAVPSELEQAFAQPPQPPVNIRVFTPCPGVEGVGWADSSGRPCLRLQAIGKALKIVVKHRGVARRIRARLPGNRTIIPAELPLEVYLPGGELQDRAFVLNNPSFGVKRAGFKARVGPAPDALLLLGVELSELLVARGAPE